MNWHLRPEFTFTLLILVGLSFNSCQRNKSLTVDGFQNKYFGIIGLNCTQTMNPNAIDSKVGTVDCGSISFNFDYGKFSNSGPLTPEEEFRRSFDTYHHIKFFEYRMIDAKVYKIFLDSVEIIEVRRKSLKDKGFYECEPCNAIAEIKFMGDTYYYPLTLSEKQLDRSGYTCTFEEKGDLVYKYHQKDNALPGVYITPKKNRYKKKNTLSLMVSETSLSDEKVDQILRGVYLKNPK